MLKKIDSTYKEGLMEKEELIQKYIKDTLTEAEQLQFDSYMESDLDFAAMVAQHTNVHKAINAHETEDLKAHLQNLEAKQTEKSSNVGYKKWIISAVLVLCLGLAGSYFWQQTQFHENLYETYYSPYPNALQPITRGNSADNVLTKAFKAYENEDYETALTELNSILESQENPNEDLIFYKGMALLNQGKENAALDELRKLKFSKTKFLPQVYWYGALIHLKFKEEEKTIKALEYMNTLQTSFKAKERKIILEKLR